MSLDVLARVALAAHACALAGLAAIGLHRLALVAIFLRSRAPDANARPPAARAVPGTGPPPHVTVQIPIYNERYVAERVLRAACRLRWPADRLEIQVLDDSTDDTTAQVARLVQEGRDRGLDVHHLRRPARDGYKAGALAAGMKRATGELFAVFDADFEPPPEFLERTAGAFADPQVGFVQVRWEHANRSLSVFTRMQALLLDGHFHVEHQARFASGHLFNFNGTAGVLRREAIMRAGGWSPDTLTEDLDLSYRIQMSGYRGVYLRGETCPGDLPRTFADFKGQQRRWVQGSIQTARKLLPDLWRSRLSLPARLEASAHLLTNLAYPLMLAAFLGLGPALTGNGAADAAAGAAAATAPLVWLSSALLVTATAGVIAFYSVAYVESVPANGPGVLRLPFAVPGALALGAGMVLSNAAAVMRGLAGPTGTFERTPKVAPGAARPPTYRSRIGWTPLAELGLGTYLAAATAAAIRQRAWGAAPLLALFAAGTLWVGVESLRERLRSAGS
jgi:hypothetical protein